MNVAYRSSQFIAASTPGVWSVLADPVRLPEWLSVVASIDAAGLDGALFRLGDRVQWIPAVAGRWVHRTFAPPLEVTRCETGRRLELTQPEPLARTVMRWTLEPVEGGTVVHQEVVAAGPLSPVYDRVLARRVAAGPHANFARLARLAGARSERPLHALIAGGTGALGGRVAADLACRGHEVTILTRGRPRRATPYRYVRWDGVTVGPWAQELERPRTVVINLAGELVDCRPTDANIVQLTASRVDSTHALVAAAAERGPVQRWVQASTTAIWSDAGEQRCTEGTPLPEPGLPQMTGVARPWEAAARGANTTHQNIIRTSIVLEPESPAFGRLENLTLAGLGGRVGSGDQWFSWIHIDDWLAIVRAALGLEDGVELPDGVVVAATEHPVRNVELMRTLRRALHRPPSPPTPASVLALGAIVLRTDPALGLTGRHATSTVLRDNGFRFAHPTLDDALADLLPARSRAALPTRSRTRALRSR
ncbi:DUF1731 domain-containing protein [Tsukamurella sp. 8F]|uniref:DUF1731 domain-containing protein n=1 Tax=unclassified Tsukamurella TaxID=2633480 RepID=UPI0023B92BA6|nr:MULTISPECIES: DUF1731 domain-containing protein [unclassified Tsukamurella]MDF0532620.1 DUF1731 domain-containing protein [Tsukamurella sp. 8J]MDF0589509.1 DUF1731 domain-containing protein [Tsukamurella sp. 8F]